MRIVKTIPLLALLCLSLGCGRYNMENVQIAFANNDYDGALIQLDAGGKRKAKLPYLMERGLIAHYGNRFHESNRTFDLAEVTSDDLYTKSISREALSLVTSDRIRAYAGSQYERLLIHYYRAFNYVYLNLPDEALVECRKAGRLLQYYADADEDYEFVGAAFIAYLSGILYEWAGDWNDAYIAYRWAEKAYRQYEESMGLPFPRDVGESLVRLSGRLGFREEFEKYAATYGVPPEGDPDAGELILLYESGFAPQKHEENLILPILTTDTFFKDEDEEDEDEQKEKEDAKDDKGGAVDGVADAQGEEGAAADDEANARDEEELRAYADVLTKRRGRQYKEVEVEYILRLAIPTYRSNRPRLNGVDADTTYGRVAGVLVEDVEAVAMKAFEQELPTIMLRTVVRGILKYLGFRVANKKSEAAGQIFNLLNVATESADTRSWQTLPNQIFLVRMRLPEGSHDITLSFSDRANRPVKTDTLPGIVIRKHDKTFMNYRTFQ